MLYACDWLWWRREGPNADEFAGRRIQGNKTRTEPLEAGCVFGGVQPGVSRMCFDGRRIGAGGHSGFQAINYAVQCGARRIVLTGYDLGTTGGRTHWHGDHTGPLTNPSDAFFFKMAKVLDDQAPKLKAHGVEIFNASRSTRLQAFERVSIKRALEKWGIT